MTDSNPAISPPQQQIRKARPAELTAELQARIAEAEWLKTHYDEQLRAAFAQIASLQARVQALTSANQPEPAGLSVEDHKELVGLRREVARLNAAEQRYLDRIEEIKEMAERDR